jgi:hypothetical protein
LLSFYKNRTPQYPHTEGSYFLNVQRNVIPLTTSRQRNIIPFNILLHRQSSRRNRLCGENTIAIFDIRMQNNGFREDIGLAI